MIWRLFIFDAIGLVISILTILFIYIALRKKAKKSSIPAGKIALSAIAVILIIWFLARWQSVAVITIPQGKINTKSLEKSQDSYEERMLKKSKQFNEQKE